MCAGQVDFVGHHYLLFGAQTLLIKTQLFVDDIISFGGGFCIDGIRIDKMQQQSGSFDMPEEF